MTNVQLTPYDAEITTLLADLERVSPDGLRRHLGSKLDSLIDQRVGYLRAKSDETDLLAVLRNIGSRPCFAQLLGEDARECSCPSCTASSALSKYEGRTP